MVSVRARRSARLMRSSYSLVRLRFSLAGRKSSSSSRSRSSSARAAAERSAPAASSARQGRSRAAAPCSGARASASPEARIALPAWPARNCARSPSPSDRRAHASARADSTPAALEPLGQRRGRQRVEAHGLAARGDRRQHLARPVGEQQQDDVVRRLLERLEQRVGRLVVHGVGALDDEHAPLRLERRVRRGGHDRLDDVLAAHHVRAARSDPRQVRMRPVLHAGAGVLGIARALGQQLGGEGARRIALAGSRGAVKQVRVVERAVERRADDRGGVRMGLEHGDGV